MYRFIKYLLFGLILSIAGCQNSAVNGQSANPEDVSSLADSQINMEKSGLPVFEQNAQRDDNSVPSQQIPAPQPSLIESDKQQTAEPAKDSPEHDVLSVHQNNDDKTSYPPYLSEQDRMAIQAIKWDEEPEVLYAVEDVNIGQHYLISDEKHPELYKKTIENLGGTYMGVGTNQGYLYIGWQRPEFGILFDYDPMVVELHQLVLAFMKVCDTADCLRHYFLDEKKGLDWIQGENGTNAGLNNKHMIRRYKKLRKTVNKSFARLEEMSEKTMMNDPETYQYIHHLALGGRLVTVRANLLGKASMKSIADGLKLLNAQVKTLYLSNAEQYWDYTPEFKENMLALPIADDGFVMRTTASYPQNGDYRYSVQPLSVFHAWMARKRCKKVAQMLKIVRIRSGEFPFVVDDKMPAAGKR